MNFEPQKFFIGLMDFFSILLPGGLLTYMLMDNVGPVLLSDEKYHQLDGSEAVAVFLVVSYLLGHMIFLLGTWLDELYDRDRGLTLNKQIKTLAHRGKLLPWFSRLSIWLVFKRESDFAVNKTVKIKEQMLEGLMASNTINTFQWAKILLAKEHPESFSKVQRFEADSKFFRCLVVVLLFIAVMWIYQREWVLARFGFMLLPLVTWRYMEQRFKSTKQAYWSVITHMANEGKVSLEKSAPEANRPTHAGGVVYRIREGAQVEYLLVEAKNDPEQWVLPKGHIEDGEHSRETAVREVHEETRVWARVQADLGTVSYTVKASEITSQFYLMEYAGFGLRQDSGREHAWFSLIHAVEKASYLETRDLLQAAEQRRIRL